MIAAYPLDALSKTCYNDFDNILLGRRASQRTDGKHTDAFQSFMLALSDQQLFSGLALTISLQVVHHGLYDLDTEVSAYSYCSAVVLAIFSCLIHLASLACLKAYFCEPQRAWLKHARVVLMLLVLALVVQPFEEMYRILHTLDDLSQSLRCALEELPVASWYSNGQDRKPTFVMGVIIFIGMLGRAYFHRVSELYSSGISVNFWTRKYTQEQVQAAEDRLLERWAESRLSLLSSFLFVFLPEFHRSFVFSLVWLLFFFAVGLVGLIQCLVGQLSFEGHNTLSDISFRPEFGQLLPLVLLGLPLFAMAEAYSGKCSSTWN